MSITYYGIEWDYNNLANIGYSSATLDEPYTTWLYQKTRAVGSETDGFEVGYNSKESAVDRLDLETLSVIDANINSVFSSAVEDLIGSFSDSYAEGVISSKKDDAVTLSSNESRGLSRGDNERLSLEDNYNKLAKRSFSDSLSVYDSYAEGVISNIKDSVIAISSDGKGLFNRIDSEKLLKFTDSNRIKPINNFIEEPISVSDSYAEGVISLKGETINLSIADDYSIPVSGVSKESPFYVIDEGKFIATDEYGQETIGEQIELGGSISLFDFEISSSPLTQSNFETWTTDNPPEDASANPFSTVTKEYFEFGLKSITSGLYLNGEISWLADGY